MKLFNVPYDATSQEIQQAKDQAARLLRASGGGRRPNPPRSLITQSGARKIIVIWNSPEDDIEGGGYRVYKNTEKTLYTEIHDASCRQIEVSASAGAAPEWVNIFISRIDDASPPMESRKVWIQGKASVEAGAPADPVPPPSWGDEPGGGDIARPERGPRLLAL